MINPDFGFVAFTRFWMGRMHMSKLAAVFAFALAAPGPLLADTIKCQGADGKWYFGDTLPPQCAKSATSTISPGGFEKKRDSGDLTPEQQAKKAAEQKTREEEQKHSLECQRRDKALVTTYTKAEDIDTARDRALQQATDAISGTRQHIADTQSLQIKLRKEADAYKNNKMPADLKQQIEEADHDLSNNQQLIVSQRKELDGIRERYAAEKKRYLEITTGNGSSC
jgi:hypothetical protein